MSQAARRRAPVKEAPALATKPASEAAPAPGSTSSPAPLDQASEEPGHAQSLRDSFWKWGRVTFALVALYVGVQLLLMLGGIVAAVLTVLLYVVFGGVVALIVSPLERLLRHVMPRWVSSLLSLLILILVVAGFGVLVGTSIVSQIKDITGNLPRLEKPFTDLQAFLTQHGVNVNLQSLATQFTGAFSKSSVSSTVLNAIGVTVGVLVDFVVVMVTAFWMLDDHESLRSGLLSILPARWRMEVDFGLNAFAVVFGGYLRGQLLLALVVGTLAGFGCAVIGVPFPLIVGVSAGVFELIPLAGPFVGAGVALVFALTVGPSLALETIGVFIVIHVIEGYVISPRLQGRVVRLHPLMTLLALLVGVEAAGFLGAFFAVPLASLLAVMVRAGVAELRTTQPELFTLTPAAQAVRGRRRALLAEYRFSPVQAVRRVVLRMTGRGRPKR
jgi:predicted PurR-regulated permease PerM